MVGFQSAGKIETCFFAMFCHPSTVLPPTSSRVVVLSFCTDDWLNAALLECFGLVKRYGAASGTNYLKVSLQWTSTYATLSGMDYLHALTSLPIITFVIINPRSINTFNVSVLYLLYRMIETNVVMKIFVWTLIIEKHNHFKISPLPTA